MHQPHCDLISLRKGAFFFFFLSHLKVPACPSLCQKQERGKWVEVLVMGVCKETIKHDLRGSDISQKNKLIQPTMTTVGNFVQSSQGSSDIYPPSGNHTCISANRELGLAA